LKARESNRYKVENLVKLKYEIDEYDLSSLEEMHEEIQFIMATQGCKMDNVKASLDEIDIFHTTRLEITAFGVYDGEKFQVLEDSEINIAKDVHLARYNQQRRRDIK